jgi:hypothetical protein
MQTITSYQPHRTRESVVSALLLVAVVAVLIASADALEVLVAVALIVSMVWGLVRGIQRRVHNRAVLASVTHLRAVPTGRHDVKATPAESLQHRRNAA